MIQAVNAHNVQILQRRQHSPVRMRQRILLDQQPELGDLTRHNCPDSIGLPILEESVDRTQQAI